jgi:hypothetical protein
MNHETLNHKALNIHLLVYKTNYSWIKIFINYKILFFITMKNNCITKNQDEQKSFNSKWNTTHHEGYMIQNKYKKWKYNCVDKMVEYEHQEMK